MLTQEASSDGIQQDEIYQVLSHPNISYDESKKEIIRQHLLDLVSKHVSFEPKMVAVKRRDGRFANLLYAVGHVRYSFRGASFSTTITIELSEHYPHSPPIIYVNCPDNMIIPHALSHISRSGTIKIPYLLSWVHSSCNLLELTKLAKILIDNGYKAIFDDLTQFPVKERRDFFDQIIRRFPNYPGCLLAHIKNKKEGLQLFINVAVELCTGLTFLRRNRPVLGENDPIYRNAEMSFSDVLRLTAYDDSSKLSIKQHILALIKYYSPVTPRIAKITRSDNISVNLLKVDVMIPYAYDGVTYRARVIIWLLESYPHRPPRVAVHCHDQCFIDPDHLNIAPSGFVFIPYVEDWVASYSNLIELVSRLCVEFSAQPPTYTPDLGFLSNDQMDRRYPNPSGNISKFKEIVEELLDVSESSKRPFVSCGFSGRDSDGAPHLKGARWFTYEELMKITNNFSGEHILVYEFMSNGSLEDVLTSRTGIILDWQQRLRVELRSAEGLAYLHELADPPIVHNNVKSSNILLDDNLTCKVAGLFKLVSYCTTCHVSTQVKGTLVKDYTTHKLTTKSDVYNFGVVMLELIMAKQLIEKGKYTIREIKLNMNKSDVEYYGLRDKMDRSLREGEVLPEFGRYVELALRCVDETADKRPTMSQVVKEIESMMS
ncbi:unnamed protein product [Cochlearia groenlandica]